MATYIIGDVHGCYNELMALLDKMEFDEKKDHLFFLGDLVNRGPDSLGVLRWVYQQKYAKTVLGNHDLHLLAHAFDVKEAPLTNSFDLFLKAPDRDELVDWLRKQPFVSYFNAFHSLVVHAGLDPNWDLTQVIELSDEVSDVLQSDQCKRLLKEYYGTKKKRWSTRLQGWSRLRYLIHVFVRSRYFNESNRSYDWYCSSSLSEKPGYLTPWYEVSHVRDPELTVYFGHWAALSGNSGNRQAVSMDGGCVWGGNLYGHRLEDGKRFVINSGGSA